MPRKPSNSLKHLSTITLEETFKSERNAWRNARKERQRCEERNRKRGTGNRLDGLCHIDGKPCTRAAKCEFKCIEVCTNLAEISNTFSCANSSTCARNPHRPRFACGLREAHLTE